VNGPNTNDGTNTIEDADSFIYSVTDNYGNTTTAAIYVNIIDDVPTINAVDHAFIANEINIAITGDIDLTPGADGLAELRYNPAIEATAVIGVTSGNLQVSYYVDPEDSNHLIGSTADSSAEAFGDSSTWVFEVKLDAGTATYDLKILQTIDAFSASPVGRAESQATGPSDWAILQYEDPTDPSIISDLAVLSGFKLADQNDLNKWYSGDESVLNTGKVNGSIAGWGESNNNFDTLEVLRIEFGDSISGNDDSNAPGLNWDGPKASGVSLDFTKNFNSTDSIWVVVNYADGTSDNVQFQIDTSMDDNVGSVTAGNIVYNATTQILTIEAPQGLTLDYVDVAGEQSSGKLIIGTVTASDNDRPVAFDIPIQAIDGDGDVADGAISAVVQGDNVGSTFTGTSGDDVFAGGLGNDILVGGDGEDAFFFNANAGEGQDTINDFNTTSDTLSFTDLLDVEPDGDFDAADVLAFTSSVTVTIVGNDLVLEIPDQTGDGADPTYVTLANVAGDYGDFTSGDSLTDLIDTVTSINVDTYAS
jgi:hypothetical protein